MGDMIATRKQLDETDKKIIEHLQSGLIYKEISQRIKITVPTIKYRVLVMKKEYNCTTLACLMAKLSNTSENSDYTKE